MTLPEVDFAGLYDGHPEYDARRQADSFERALVELEVQAFKLPNLLSLLDARPVQRVLEIGCATGELIAAFPVAPGGLRMGVDISERNVAAAAERFPGLHFRAGDFRALRLERFDLVLLSDVLEHVPDDAAFLADAARLGGQVLMNLPLECNWLNRTRRYGPQDVSGHLRAYTLAHGLALLGRAGLQPLRWRRVWIHETAAEARRRTLRRRILGHAFGGPWPLRTAKQAAFELARRVRPVGRALFASNLFVLAAPRGAERA